MSVATVTNIRYVFIRTRSLSSPTHLQLICFYEPTSVNVVLIPVLWYLSQPSFALSTSHSIIQWDEYILGHHFAIQWWSCLPQDCFFIEGLIKNILILIVIAINSFVSTFGLTIVSWTQRLIQGDCRTLKLINILFVLHPLQFEQPEE